MLGKFLQPTQSRPCSCPEEKKCTACAETKCLKPRFCIETSKSPPPIPIVINHFRRHSNTIRIKDSLSRLKPLKKETRGRAPSIRQWYKKRKAQSDLKKEELYERESINKAYREREKELLEQFKEQQKFIDSLSQRRSSPVLEIPKVSKTEKKKKEPKAKSTNTTKTKNYVIYQKHKESLGVRCANWWYRACCKFFCCLSCVLIISIVVVFILPLVG